MVSTSACLGLGALVAALASCGRTVPSAPDAGPELVDFADAEASVDPFGDAGIAPRARALLGRCAGGPESGCHVANAGGMRLPDDPSATNLIDVPSTQRPELPRVAPGDPWRSYLFLKVLGDGGIDGAPMPPSSAPDPRIPAVVYAWIEAGAP
jgi:hypothetical protein